MGLNTDSQDLPSASDWEFRASTMIAKTTRINTSWPSLPVDMPSDHVCRPYINSVRPLLGDAVKEPKKTGKHRRKLSVPCLRPRNCGWAADLARGLEWTQKIWRKFKWILNCLSYIGVRLDQNAQFSARKCRSSKILGQTRGRKKDLAKRPQSH